jgi:hypothetical protein
MAEPFTTRVGGEGPLGPDSPPFLEVPAEVVDRLGPGKRPKVSVTVKGHTFRSTVAVYGGQFYLPLNKENRAAAGAELGELVEVSLEPDSAPREVVLPPDLEAALARAPRARAAFDRLSYSIRKAHAEAIGSAKREETRRRRLEKMLAGLEP